MLGSMPIVDMIIAAEDAAGDGSLPAPALTGRGGA